jgi:hypothetical protein
MPTKINKKITKQAFKFLDIGKNWA